MANNQSRIGPTTALTLLQLWMERKQSASVQEVELWESIVIQLLNAVEERANALWGTPDEVPDYVHDPSDG